MNIVSRRRSRLCSLGSRLPMSCCVFVHVGRNEVIVSTESASTPSMSASSLTAGPPTSGARASDVPDGSAGGGLLGGRCSPRGGVCETLPGLNSSRSTPVHDALAGAAVGWCRRRRGLVRPLARRREGGSGRCQHEAGAKESRRCVRLGEWEGWNCSTFQNSEPIVL